MPPGILYLHGDVHFNGGWLLFNDFSDAIRHFSDRRFAAEFKRFVCFMRSILPWFSNSNGPKKFVLWGNPSPYPTVNTITGNWIADCRRLETESGRSTAARPPIRSEEYFQDGPYLGDRATTRWPENLLAAFTDVRIRLRGERENLYFVDKRKLQRGFRFGPDPIPTPWQRLRRAWQRVL